MTCPCLLVLKHVKTFSYNCVINYTTYFILYPRASALIRVLSHFLTFSMTPQNVQGDIDCVLAYKVNRRPAFPDF